MVDADLVFTQHAEDMLVERGIDRAWVEETIRNPDAVEPDPNHREVFRAFRQVPQHGGRILRVVYTPTGGALKVLTAFFDRRRRRS
jgi:hypothetical protein